MTLEELIRELTRIKDNYRNMTVVDIREQLTELEDELHKVRMNLFL